MTWQANVQVKQKRVIIITLIVVAILITDVTITGFLKFGYNFARCGSMPIMLQAGAFAGQPVYALPGHYTPGGVNNDYVCTEQEAIDRGLRKNLYD